MKDFSLEGRTALVTGGNSGIGLGLARGLARAGARVAVTGRDADKLAVAEDELKSIAPGSRGFAIDLSNLDGLEAFYTDAAKEMGGFDCLFNNAGTTVRRRADQTPLDEWHRVLNLNLTVPYALSQCFARQHIESRTPGSIVMTGSLMCAASRPTTSAYTASKGGIRQLVMSLAVDWAAFGIRVNAISPGYIDTPMTQALVNDAEFDAWIKKRTPLGRWGTPSDFEGAAVFLASDASAFITGQILYVDGGFLATF